MFTWGLHNDSDEVTSILIIIGSSLVVFIKLKIEYYINYALAVIFVFD